MKPLNRIEATTILIRALGLEDVLVSESSEFTDISDDYWGKKYANIAKERGISYGVGDDRFAPEERMNAVQFGALLLRSAQGDTFDWEQSVALLIEKGIITQEQSENMDLFTRGDVFKIIYEAREQGLLAK